MNDILPVNFTFVGTTVEPTPVVEYLLSREYPATRTAESIGASQFVIDSLQRAEFVGLHLRRFVAGYWKNLRPVFEDVRCFVRDYPTVAVPMIQVIILKIRRDLLSNEWYEPMPRFEKAVTKIERLLI